MYVVALASVLFCASATQIDGQFCLNMLVCVLNLQARRALARKEVKRGWILRARRIGAARRKRQRHGKRRWLKCRLCQVGPFLWLLALAHVTRNVANAAPELSRPVSQHWYIARKKRNRRMHAINGNPGKRRIAAQPQPRSPKDDGRAKKVKTTDAQEILHRRIRSQMIKMPGDGWCFFHAIHLYFRESQGWDLQAAAELYLQALEWLWQARHGEQAARVDVACVPFDDHEAALHEGFLWKQATCVETAGLTQTEITLLSKLHALVHRPAMLDSIHHASAGVDLWALTQAFAFDCLIWGKEENSNYWVRTMEHINDEEAHAKLATHAAVLELVHSEMGITGHYDLVERSKNRGERFPVTPLLTQFRTGGAAQVLRTIHEQVQDRRPPLPPPGTPPGEEVSAARSQSSDQKAEPSADQASPSEVVPTAVPSRQEGDVSGGEWERLRGETKPEEQDAGSGSEAAATDEDMESVQSWDSDASISSNDIDAGLNVEAQRSWSTMEDEHLETVNRLAQVMKKHVLLPPPLSEDADSSQVPNTGVVFPPVHCAIQNCRWCSPRQPCELTVNRKGVWTVKGTRWQKTSKPCCDDVDTCLWQHLQHSHANLFTEVSPDQVPSLYRASLCVCEQQGVPQVGWSTDRRTFQRLAERCTENNFKGLICACCARIHVAADNGEIGYLPVNDLFSSLTQKSFEENWSHATYAKRYANIPAITERFQKEEWVRTVPTRGEILCCPEDIRCDICQPKTHQLCGRCEVPVCRSCITRMTQKFHAAVPQALTNDNWLGYPSELLYKHRVRWIEAAAACPVWTSMVCFYLESDRGHVFEEEIHRAEHRLAVRGNVSSCSMPWEEILATLDPTHDGHKRWDALPHTADTLRALVKITVKGMKYNEAIEWVSGAKIRPWVVIALLHHLVDLAHPMCEELEDAQDEKERIARKVTAMYGATETSPLIEPPTTMGITIKPTQPQKDQPNKDNPSPADVAQQQGHPKASFHTKVAVQAKGPEDNSKRSTERRSVPTDQSSQPLDHKHSTERRSVPRDGEPRQPHGSDDIASTPSGQVPTKHATPEVVTDVALEGEAFTGMMRPHILSQDYTGSQVQDSDTAFVNSLATTTHEIGVQTGTDFWDQWRTDFLHWAYPFSLPAPASGPDFPQKAKCRRRPESVAFGPVQHLKHLAGRVESSIRNSWDLVPGLRRITAKWTSVCGGTLWRRWQTNKQKIEAVPASEWVQAAEGLYKKLQRGKYCSADGVERPIQYDARKLMYAKGLTGPEKQLLQDVRSMQQTVPGTIEVRRRIGRYLFGARVELGEPLFVTISPTMRHNNLSLKLSRYRGSDPGRAGCHQSSEPKLWESVETDIHLPGYDTRREMTARDPWAVVLSFQAVVRLIFAQLLGIQMCFRCPQCACRDAHGYSCHPTGGVLGLVRGLCGAIEYQANSTPHFHCNVYIASIWQAPLTVLLEKIKATEITSEDVARFLSWIHDERHPEELHHEQNQERHETDWKQNFCQPTYDHLSQWPRFIHTDGTASPWLHRMNPDAVTREAAQYVARYRHAVQTKFSTQQCHWHPWDPKLQCRVPLAGCKKKGAPNKCKHSFPKPLNDMARVVCRGNARKFHLSTRGRRNALGLWLGERRDPWLSGTLKAFTIFLFGNSHTAVNFRVPLCDVTHDPTCNRNCLEKTTVTKLQQVMQQAARRATKYFTGYLQKPQPVGKQALQQAAKQLHFLATTDTKDPTGTHYRKVANRVFGDLEFRCSVRPITEEFMLAGFGNADDPAAAECIRSFPVKPFVGAEWLTLLDGLTEPRHKVQPESQHSSEIKLSELYGWRGLDPRLYHLSPWEFVKWWTAKKLQPPPEHNTEDETILSEWVLPHDPSNVPKDGWKFGRDYVWKTELPPSCQVKIHRLPKKFQTRTAQAYYFERNTEPVVPYPTVCPLPRPDMSKEDQARLLNVYLRPWTLDAREASPHVPHIAALDLPFNARTQPKPRHRLVGKQSLAARSHLVTWKEYIQAHIVSQHAKITIQNFLAAAECSPEETDPMEPVPEFKQKDVDTSWVDVNTLHKLTQGVGFEYSKRSGPAVQQILETWKPVTSNPDQALGAKVGRPEVVLEATPSTTQRPQPTPNPNTVQWTYGNLNAQTAAAWLERLQDPSNKQRPTSEQLQFLRWVIDRCLQEATEERQQAKQRSDPCRTLFHGVPGAGKSQTLAWLRQFFEEICGWQHGHEFVYLAPQNTQAALIHGITLHSFANIRIKGKNTQSDAARGPEQYVQYQRLRWIIIDECSTVGLEVLATVEKKLTQATRVKGTWKQNHKGQDRAFGGVNMVITGDMWQFPPVKATAIYQNPFANGYSFQVAALQKFFWSRQPEGIPCLFELTVEQRCTDPWLSYVLKQARHGTMAHEVWCYLHGFPTLHPGTWDFDKAEVTCGAATCQQLVDTWACSDSSWPERVAEECKVCQTERTRRCVIGRDQKAAKFLLQPYIHGLNAAKYIAANLRAKEVATQQGTSILWIVAQDTPLFHLDTDATSELHARKSNWLQRHDQSTGGIVGLLPLIPDMPIRVTQTLPELRPYGLYKNTRGKLIDWTLSEQDTARIPGVQAPDIILEAMPKVLYIKIANATWQQHPSLPPGVACIRPIVQHWQLETAGKATVARRGFPIASDLAGTAHSFMGATLEACTLDLGVWDAGTSRDAQLSGYMCMSRVKRCEDLCVAQPFSPNLFRNGELVGPHTFLEFHRGTRSLEEAKNSFQKDTTKRQRQPDLLLYCRMCSPRRNMPDKLVPLREFHNASTRDAWFAVVTQGMDAVCLRCHKELDTPEPAVDPDTPTLCAFCATNKAQKSGYCKTCLKTERLACARCDIGRKMKIKTLKDFNPAEIRRRKRTKELRRARCKKCEAKPASSTARQGICVQCDKAVSVAHLTNYTAATNAGVCRACVQKASRAPKTCGNCSKPLHASATPGTWCRPCAYPPCSAGCGEPRPQKGKYHAKHLPVWKCPKCRYKPCSQCGAIIADDAMEGTWCVNCNYPPCSGCAAPRPQREEYRSTHMPHWKCSACRAQEGYPPCPGCGQNRPCERRYHVKLLPEWTCADCLAKPCPKCGGPLAAQANADTWCQACAYPPCPGCGQERPSNHRYHAQVMPDWTCAGCLAKPCPKCGQAIAAQASADTWCQACAYPPCPSCGQERPSNHRYHAQVMPDWTCAGCLAKPCPKCGQAIAAQASADTWCQACAYPPCPSCGQDRPDNHRYHAQVMPDWTCAGCLAKPCPKCGQAIAAQASADTWCQACAYPPCPSCGQDRPDNHRYHAQVMPKWTCAVCRQKKTVETIPKKRRTRPK